MVKFPLGPRRVEARSEAAIIGSSTGSVRALKTPCRPINQTQIKGVSVRIMFNQKDIVRRSINSFLCLQPSGKAEQRPSFVALQGVFCLYIGDMLYVLKRGKIQFPIMQLCKWFFKINFHLMEKACLPASVTSKKSLHMTFASSSSNPTSKSSGKVS